MALSYQIVEQFQDMAGKYRVRIDLGFECRFLKFHSAPTKQQIDRVVAEIEDRLQEEELENMFHDDVLTTRFITKTQIAARIRRKLRTASAEQLARIARWIINRIQDGDFTENQVRNALDLTLAQWNDLKTRLQQYKAALDTVETAKENE